jgi:CRISPR-associated protein Csd2
MPAINNRHDILILFDVTNGNPNGDPDAGNLPRIDPTTNKGLVSDVCLKRKVRNFVTQFAPTRKADDANGFSILVQQGNILNNEIAAAITKATGPLDKKATDKQKAEAGMKWLCREFYDVRTFGGVLSTGDDVLERFRLRPSARPGAVHLRTLRRSDHAALEISITRCAVTKPEDEKKERTMGNKHIVPYALYVAKAYISPVFAERTGFDEGRLSRCSSRRCSTCSRTTSRQPGPR